MTQESNTKKTASSNIKLAMIRIIVLVIIIGIGYGIAMLGGGDVLYSLFSICKFAIVIVVVDTSRYTVF